MGAYVQLASGFHDQIERREVGKHSEKGDGCRCERRWKWLEKLSKGSY